MDAIPERVEPPARRPLGRQMQLDLEFSDFVLPGVVGPLGHAPVLPSSSNTDEAGPLPIAGGCVVRPAQAVLQAPPPPFRPVRDFTVPPLIRAHRFSGNQPQARGGEGFSSPASTLRPFRSLYPGEFLTAAHQALRGVHGLRHLSPGSAPPCPLTGHKFTRRQDSRDAKAKRTGRSLAPPKGTLSLGSAPGRFPPTPPACYPAP
jgi:hypothetical protein